MLCDETILQVRKQYIGRVEEISSLEPAMQKMSDEELKGMTEKLRAKVAAGASLDSVLIEAFAVHSIPVNYFTAHLFVTLLYSIYRFF